MKEFRASPPAAVVIDLGRLPSHVEGDPENVAKGKETLPGARYTTYAKFGPVLVRSLTTRPR